MSSPLEARENNIISFSQYKENKLGKEAKEKKEDEDVSLYNKWREQNFGELGESFQNVLENQIQMGVFSRFAKEKRSDTPLQEAIIQIILDEKGGKWFREKAENGEIIRIVFPKIKNIRLRGKEAERFILSDFNEERFPWFLETVDEIYKQYEEYEKLQEAA